MPTLDIDVIAGNIYDASCMSLKEEKKASDKKDKSEYSIEKKEKFVKQFKEEFDKMYPKTLQKLHINQSENPKIASDIKDELLRVLDEESGESIIDPKTHTLNFTSFSKNSENIAKQRVKELYSSELKKATENPELSSSSSNKLQTLEENSEKTKSSFDKLLEDYHSLLTPKEKMDFISQNMIYDSENLSNHSKDILAKHISDYLDYKQFVKGIRESNPDISRVELRNMYLEEHPELDKEEFYDKVDFTKSYLKLKQAKEDLEQELLPDELAAYSEAVKYYMEKYNLSTEIAEKLCENLNDGEPTIDEEQEFFVNAYATLNQLQEDYENNPSPQLAQEITKHENFINEYTERYSLSSEDVMEIINRAVMNEYSPQTTNEITENQKDFEEKHFCQVLDDKGSNAKEVRDNIKSANDKQQNNSTEIPENPIIKFFKDKINKFTQKALGPGQENKTQSENITQADLNIKNSMNTQKAKGNIFSRMKNMLSTLVNVNQSRTSTVEIVQNDTIPETNNPNLWGALPQEQRINLQNKARDEAKKIQNNSKHKTVIETDNSLQIE